VENQLIMQTTTYPIEFLREIESKHKINIEADFIEFQVNNPWAEKLTINESIQKLIMECCLELNVSVSDLKSKIRTRELVLLRQYLMSYCYDKYPISLKSIGFHFGDRDHTTVIHARQQIENLRDTKDALLTYYETKLSGILT